MLALLFDPKILCGYDGETPLLCYSETNSDSSIDLDAGRNVGSRCTTTNGDPGTCDLPRNQTHLIVLFFEPKMVCGYEDETPLICYYDDELKNEVYFSVLNKHLLDVYSDLTTPAPSK